MHRAIASNLFLAPILWYNLGDFWGVEPIKNKLESAVFLPIFPTTPMSKRLYYADSYTTSFEATIVEQLEVDGSPAVVLAESFFYPTSGGQPFDGGRLGERSVVDVIIREDDRAVVHVLDGALALGMVSAEIDKQRRFDHMQQHSGQHILSQAFIQVMDASTVSFHLGKHGCTIDLDCRELSAENLSAAEQLANEIIWQNRPINCYFVNKSKLSELPLRKVPDVVGDEMRIVDIVDFDVNACGGTHVAHTGEVGQIKVGKLERIRNSVRVEFFCGERALSYARAVQGDLGVISAEFTCPPSDIPNAVHKLRAEIKQAKKAMKAQQSKLIGYEVAELQASAVPKNGLYVIARAFAGYDGGQLRQIANQLVQQENTIVFVGSESQLIFARSQHADGDMGALIKPYLAELGGSGGGKAQFAQGGGLSAEIGTIQTIIEQAKAAYFKQFNAAADPAA